METKDLIDLTPTIQQLISQETAVTRLTTSKLAGLGLGHSLLDDTHRLTLSRVGRCPTDEDVRIVGQAITAVTRQISIEQERPYTEGEHHCIALTWQPVNVRDFFSMDPAAQKQIRKQVK